MICTRCGQKEANEYIELCDKCRLDDYSEYVGRRVRQEPEPEARENE